MPVSAVSSSGVANYKDFSGYYYFRSGSDYRNEFLLGEAPLSISGSLSGDSSSYNNYASLRLSPNFSLLAGDTLDLTIIHPERIYSGFYEEGNLTIWLYSSAEDDDGSETNIACSYVSCYPGDSPGSVSKGLLFSNTVLDQSSAVVSSVLDDSGNIIGFNITGTLMYDLSFFLLAFYSGNSSSDTTSSTGTLTVNFPSNDWITVSSPSLISDTSGTITIQSSQILDDSASFVVAVSDLASSESVYNIRWILTSGGEEVKSSTTDSLSSSDYGLHLTIPDLDPETEYEIQFILQEDGVDTSVTTSTTFTTLAGEGTPDYSDQLDDIQQGIGDVQTSVDNVGTKLDGVQDTLTETKEEITSLPEKIATSISDAVVGLFVPSEEDLVGLKDEYEDMLSEKLGFVWQAYDLTTTTVSGIHDNMKEGSAYEFTFPGVKLPMQGEEFVLVPETAVSLDNDLMSVLRPVFGTAVSFISVVAFVNMAAEMVIAIISGIKMWDFHRRVSYNTSSGVDDTTSSSDSYSPW